MSLRIKASDACKYTTAEGIMYLYTCHGWTVNIRRVSALPYIYLSYGITCGLHNTLLDE